MQYQPRKEPAIQSQMVYPMQPFPALNPIPSGASQGSAADFEKGNDLSKHVQKSPAPSTPSYTFLWQIVAFLLALALILVCVFGFREDCDNKDEADAALDAHKKLFVYAMDNQMGNNRVHVFSHDENPTELTLVGSYSTGGSGFPFGLDGPANVLASQHALLRHEKWVFACNAGSNQITTFEVLASGELSRASVTNTEGVFPTSIAAYNDHVCAVTAESRGAEAGMGGHIECYRVTYKGRLIPDPDFMGDVPRLIPVEHGIPFPPGPDGKTGYWEGCPGGCTDPAANGPIVAGRTVAQVSFAPEGDAVIVTAKSTGIFVFPIQNRHLTGPKIWDVANLKSHTEDGIVNLFGSDGGLPFSFTFHTSVAGERYIAVTEPIAVDGGIPAGGGVISFRFDPFSDPPLTQLTGIVHPENDPLVTPCWLERAPDSDFMWSANTNEGTITTFELGDSGIPTIAVSRTLLPEGPPGSSIREDIANGPLFDTPRGALALDLAVSGCGGFLYVLDPGFNRVVAFHTHPDGSLTAVGEGTNTGVIPIPENGVHPGVMGITASPCEL